MKKYILFFVFILFIPIIAMDSCKEFVHEITQDLEIILDLIDPQLEEEIAGEQAAIANNPYKHIITHVQQGNTISEGEQKYRIKREPIVRAALQKYLNCTLDNKKTPTITCIFSGGGYRAMLGALGSLLGIKKQKLLKCITYIASLSGSTWAIAPWLSTKMSLEDFSLYVHKQIEKHLYTITKDEKLLLANMIAVKELSKQPVTLVDLYGGLLGNRLLKCMKEKRHIISLSEEKQVIDNGSLPYPIYTAINGNEKDVASWYTFTPHQLANLNYNISVSPEGCGRHYKKGTSINHTPELPLSVLLGTWGSALAATIDSIITTLEEEEPSYKEFLELLKTYLKKIGKDHLIPCELKLPNFTKGMNTPLSDHKNLQLIDAGIEINLPYPPVSGIWPERTADIMFFFDNSEGPLGDELKKCCTYAKKNNLPFPPINFTDIDKKTISVFKGNQEEPLIIYMPGISDSHLWEKYKSDPQFKNYNLTGFDLKKETENGFCQTQYFQYSLEHSNLVSHQTEFNILANQDIIPQAIKWKIDTL